MRPYAILTVGAKDLSPIRRQMFESGQLTLDRVELYMLDHRAYMEAVFSDCVIFECEGEEKN